MGLCAIIIVLSVCLRHIIYFIYSCRAHVALKFLSILGYYWFTFAFYFPFSSGLHCSFYTARLP